MTKKKIALIGVIALLFASAAGGCGTEEADSSQTEASSGFSSAADAAVKDTDTDYAKLLAGLDGTTAVATIEGDELSAELFCYWLTYYEKQVYDTYGESVNWEMAVDSGSQTTLEEYVKAEALQTAATYILLEQKAEEYGISLTDAQQEEIDGLQESYIERYGEDGYVQNLQSETVHLDLLQYMQTVQYLHENLMDKIFAEGSEDYPSQDDIDKYAEDGNFYKVRYLWFEVYDEDGTALSGDELEAVEEEADAALAQIRDSEDEQAEFEALLAENDASDEMMEGILAEEGTFTDAFEEAAYALEDGEISDVVYEEDYGYFIIERMPLEMAEVTESYLDELKEERLSEWMQEADAETLDAYADVDVEAYYEHLLEYIVK